MIPPVGPTNRTGRAFLATAWTLVTTSWETIVWGNVRAGSVSLAGQPRSFRLLIRGALWLVILLLGLLLFADTWRAVSPLVPLVADTQSLGGQYAPQLLVSLTIGLLALAWTYVITGSLHSPWWAKVLVLVLLVVFDAGLSLTLLAGALEDLTLLTLGASGAVWGLAALVAHALGWLMLLVWYLWRWRRPARLGLEFPVTLLLAMLLFFSSHLGALLGNNTFQSESTASALQLTSTLQVIAVFLTPFILISGAEVAQFGMAITQEFTSRLARLNPVTHRWPRRLWVAALAVFLLWRLALLWLWPLFSRSWQVGWGALLAVLGVLLLLVLWRGRPSPGTLPTWVIPLTAVTLYAVLFLVQVLGFIEALVASVALMSGQDTGRLVSLFNGVFAALASSNEIIVGGLALLFGLALWVRARLQRQGLPAAALYAWIFGVWIIFWVTTRSGQALGRLSFHYPDLETLFAPLLLLLVVAGALFRRLSSRALLHLTAAALLLWLLESQSWLSDPLSPLQGLFGAPAIFISLGILLNVFSAGNHFALNTDHAHFPRLSRALLYFGYAILTVTTINWLAATHAAGAIDQNNQVAQNGFIALGLPLAIWALVTANPDLLGLTPQSAE